MSALQAEILDGDRLVSTASLLTPKKALAVGAAAAADWGLSFTGCLMAQIWHQLFLFQLLHKFLVCAYASVHAHPWVKSTKHGELSYHDYAQGSCDKVMVIRH